MGSWSLKHKARPCDIHAGTRAPALETLDMAALLGNFARLKWWRLECRSSTPQGNMTPNQTYEKSSDYYFDSYSHFGIHEDMLKDRVLL